MALYYEMTLTNPVSEWYREWKHRLIASRYRGRCAPGPGSRRWASAGRWASDRAVCQPLLQPGRGDASAVWSIDGTGSHKRTGKLEARAGLRESQFSAPCRCL